jgi:lipopolysaccharide transport protein LptA
MKRIFLAMLLAAAVLAVRAQTNLPVKTTATVQPTEINSDSADFDLNGRRAEYRGHVVVLATKLKLQCDRLVVELPENGQQHVNHVLAEQNVTIDFTDEKNATYHVTATNAVYSFIVANGMTNELVVLTGSPKVETADTVITSEPLTWDRGTGHFIFNNPHMISRQGLNGAEGTNGVAPKLF